MNEEKLLKIKRDIEAGKQKMSELQGELNALLKQLKEDHGCSSLKEAKEKLLKLDNKVKSLDVEILEKTEAIELKYFNSENK